MKIQCHRESFLEYVSVAAAAAPAKATNPVLVNVRLDAEKDASWATATDTEIAVRVRLPEVVVDEPGSALAPAHTLVEILKNLESSEVEIAAETGRCTVRAEDGEFELVTEDAESFPVVPPAVAGGVVVPVSFLREAVQRTAFCVSRDVGRYAVHGLHVRFVDGELRVAGTDGRRLALARRPVPDAPKDPVEGIVPPKAMVECLRGAERDESVRVAIGEGRIALVSDSVEVSARLIEGQFPDYERILPEDRKGRATIERDALLAGLRKTAIFAGSEIRAVELNFDEGTLELSGKAEGRGSGRTSVPVEVEGETPFKAAYNPDFLADYLKVLPPGPVAFDYREPAVAAVLHPLESDDLYVVMPITTS